MFKNIHKKIKLIAHIEFLILSIVSFCGGIYYFFSSIKLLALANQVSDTITSINPTQSIIIYLIIAILFIIIGVFVAWVISCLIYGFGELIESNLKIEKNTNIR